MTVKRLTDNMVKLIEVTTIQGRIKIIVSSLTLFGREKPQYSLISQNFLWHVHQQKKIFIRVISKFIRSMENYRREPLTRETSVRGVFRQLPQGANVNAKEQI